MAGVGPQATSARSCRMGAFPRRVVTGLSVADRVLDQFSADGAEENYLYCNPAPNGTSATRIGEARLIFEA
jgi:hypothetical protein